MCLYIWCETVPAGNYALLPAMFGVGIHSVHNIQLWKKGVIVPAKVQLILVTGHPRPSQTFSQFIIHHFDITVCKCYVRLDNEDNLGRVVVADRVRADIMNGEFEYTVLPFRTFRNHQTRLYKYAHNGFSLRAVTFARTCTFIYADHILCRFNHMMYGINNAHRMLLTMGHAQPPYPELVASMFAIRPVQGGSLYEWKIICANIRHRLLQPDWHWPPADWPGTKRSFLLHAHRMMRKRAQLLGRRFIKAWMVRRCRQSPDLKVLHTPAGYTTIRNNRNLSFMQRVLARHHIRSWMVWPRNERGPLSMKEIVRRCRQNIQYHRIVGIMQRLLARHHIRSWMVASHNERNPLNSRNNNITRPRPSETLRRRDFAEAFPSSDSSSYGYSN